MRKLLQHGLAALLVLAFATPASAQPSNRPTALFAEESELAITIEAPLGSLVRNAPRSTAPVQATLILTGAGEPQRFAISLSARGITRRTGGVCSFPPLRIDFGDTSLRGTVFRGQGKLKLVTHCRPGSNFEQNTVMEYTAYRLFNAVTPVSFRVRPVRVTYHDTDGRRSDETRFAFLIEDVDDMAHRNDRVALDVLSGVVTSSQLDPDASARFGLFEYMIGNLDWDQTQGHAGEECCHNSKLIAQTQQTRTGVISVPYDFDYSGLVNADYAVPPAGLPVQNVRQRLYRGLCRHNDALPGAIALFQSRRTEIMAAVTGESRLNEARRRSAQQYLENFFEVIDDPARVQSQLIERCRR
ncbi:hypothetical protein [Terricaulis sp.]|uniref:hypothetical protein n=1 Tax=Terricaulis sp. TaxID=2768686 RepID=UPI00378443D2